MKNVLFVVDERCMGGVSILLMDIFKMMDTSNLDIDLLVLHDRGDMFDNLPSNVHLMFGDSYFSAIDLTIKEVLKTKDIKLIYHKLKVIFDLKTGLIKKKIVKERKKLLKKHYDYEVAFKDGFTAIFTAYGDSDVKYHWIQYNYGIANPNSKYNNLFNDALRRFDKIISVSDGIMRGFNNIYHLNDKVEVIDNLIDTNRIKEKAKEKCDLVLDKNKLNIICVGRIANGHKGYDRLVDVIGKLNREDLFDDCILRIFGNGPDYDTLFNQIKDLNLEDKVLLMGRVNNPYKYFNGQDLFILPSRYEAFGLVIVEALSLGVPVLVTENDATGKIVSNDIDGLIVNNSDDGLYAGLKYLITNSDVLNKFKSNLNNYCYDNESIVKKLNELFK